MTNEEKEKARKELMQLYPCKTCEKCGDKGWYEDRASLIRFKCNDCSVKKVRMKAVSWGESNE